MAALGYNKDGARVVASELVDGKEQTFLLLVGGKAAVAEGTSQRFWNT